MSQQKQNFEDFFHNSFEGYTEKPSGKVLRIIKRKLWVSDFFSFRMKKVNVAYVLILSSILGTALVINKSETSEKNVIANTPSTTINQAKISNDVQKEITVNNLKSAKGTSESSEVSAKALFEATEISGCAPLLIKFLNKSIVPADYETNWDFGTGEKSSSKNPEYTFEKSGKYQVVLTIRKKDKEFTNSQIIEVFEKPIANFEIDIANSEMRNRKILFRNKSIGGNTYQWSFGDRSTSMDKDVQHIYKNYDSYRVSLITTSKEGCTDTSTIINNFINKEYKLIFPVNFRPNTNEVNNGYYESARNEPFVFYPKNDGVESYELAIFAPNGSLIFSSNNIKQGWNGYVKGKVAPSGNYSFTAKGTYPNGKSFDMKGTVKVIVEDYTNY